jgi:hypothetical protein
MPGMPDLGRRRLRVLSWVSLAVTVAIPVGGLVYDGTRAGEDPDLSPLYMVGVALGLLAMVLGLRARGDREGEGRRERRNA